MYMIKSKQILIEELRTFNESIVETLRAKKIDDTRAAARSLSVVETERGAKSVGINYIEFLDRGRPPGKFPPVNKIRDWVASKLGISDEKERNSIAYLVGRKISRECSTIFKDKSKGLELDKKIAKFTQQLLPKLELGIAAEFAENITTTYKKYKK